MIILLDYFFFINVNDFFPNDIHCLSGVKLFVSKNRQCLFLPASTVFILFDWRVGPSRKIPLKLWTTDTFFRYAQQTRTNEWGWKVGRESREKPTRIARLLCRYFASSNGKLLVMGAGGCGKWWDVSWVRTLDIAWENAQKQWLHLLARIRPRIQMCEK